MHATRVIEALGARTLDPTVEDVPALIADRANGNGNGVDAAFDAAGVGGGVGTGVHRRAPTTGERPIHDQPLSTPLINLVLS